MKVNVCAENKGWLFEDLKGHFERVGADFAGVDVVCTDFADTSADMWIVMRPEEVPLSVPASRVIAQCHDVFGDFTPQGQHGRLRDYAQLKSFVLANPLQYQHLWQAGCDFRNTHVVCRPIGSHAECHAILRPQLMPRFTVGWVGRPMAWGKQDVKRLDWLVQSVVRLARSGVSPHVVLMGEGLGGVVEVLKKQDIEVTFRQKSKMSLADYAEAYSTMDCLLVTSSHEAGPLCMFEAMSVGVPIVTSGTGWGGLMVVPSVTGYICEQVDQFAGAMSQIADQRAMWFERRHMIAAAGRRWLLDDWIRENLSLAGRVYQEG